jgi:hypothetical protein
MRERAFFCIRNIRTSGALILGGILCILCIGYMVTQLQLVGEKVGDIVTTKKALAHYQFTPTFGTIITGASTTINSAAVGAAEGVNTGSWKGTLANDDFHWVVAGAGASGLDMNLTFGGVKLNGANKLIIQTEFDLDVTALATEVQICDWTSSTDVDDLADDECTGGGWRTLNTKNASQVPVTLTHTSAVTYQWHIYNGYWSTGTTGGTSINTPLTNFLNGADEIKIRYFSSTNSASQIAIDFLRVYAIVDPIYHAGDFTPISGGTPAGHYGNTFSVGNITNAQQVVSAGDGLYLDVPGTVGTSTNFYLTFKNVKTYTGMNTILVNAETLCSAATADLQYRFKIRNFNNGTWEDISQSLDCSTTGFFNNFAINNIVIDDYINGSDEIWVGVYALSNSTTNIRIDSIYLMLGTTNTDENACELSFGTTTAGRLATNPSAPGSDRIQALTSDGTYLYAAGYDSVGIDNRWRIEKRNLSDGALVSAFGVGGATTSDPSALADQIFAIATSSGAVFVAGADSINGATAGQWRIEKRDSTDGSLITGFDTDGIIQFNPVADLDQITAIATDASYLYVAGFEDDDVGVWRIHKYDITTGAIVNAFGTNGSSTQILAAGGDERPQAIKVDADYLYIGGFDNLAGNIQWRLEKRNKTTGALCAGGGECAAGAFDTDGVVQTNPSSGIDAIRALALNDAYIFLAGYDSSTTNNQWRIEKRDIATGALVTAFDTDGIVQHNPSTGVDWITALALDDTTLYAVGNVGAGAWRVDARDITTGASTTFSGNGTALSEDGGDDQPLAVVLEGGYLYVAGYGTAPGDNQWLIEKRATSTGLRSNDSFGANDCTGTRNIDITGGNRDAWTVQSENESTNFAYPFYAFDNDGDASLDEASAANVEFSVAVPANAAVSGIYWAGRAMSGAGGTVRLGLKDYAGFTNTTGGKSLVGASLTTALAYTDALVATGAASGGMAGYLTNPEDHVDTVNNKMNLSLVTTTAVGTTTNPVAVWDFAMVSFSWVEDADHESTTYQFTPTFGTIITGASTTINSAAVGAAEGVNTGSWKGTLANDDFHWVVAGAGASGLNMNLTFGGVKLNGANKLIIQTEFDLDPTALATEVQICDWTSSTDVDDLADDECTGGGWRTLNTKNASQVPVTLTHTSAVTYQWHIYNGYWSTGTTGGTSINTPLTNFLNGADEIKIRYFSSTNSASQIAIDFLRVYAIVDPIYHAGDFTPISGGTPAGHYGNTFSVGNITNAQQVVSAGDTLYLEVPGTVGTSTNFYLTFKNVKTYTGMNTILVNAETLCSLATADLQYRFKIRNFNNGTWEDISQSLDCSTTGFFNNFAINNIVIDDYINGSDEIWVGVYALSNSTTNIRIDSIYLMLGTTNTDENACELSFGTTTAGRLATNPSAPGSDRIQALTSDGTYLYAAGYDSVGIDNRWRIEKRNLSDGALVSAFGVGGATTSDPSALADQIFAIATSSGAVFVAGADSINGATAGQWRIEKRDSTDGSLITGFDTDGIIQFNPVADLDQITAIATDASYLYVAGFEDDDVGVWRIHKYDITTGAIVNAFGTNGSSTQILAAGGDERPQAIKVDADYLYIGGFDNLAGNIQWRLEKRNKTTGALCAGGGECAAGAFDTDGVVQTNPSSGIDAIRALALNDAYIFLAGYDSSTTNNQWRIEKRDIATGALVTAFDTDGIVQHNPSTGVDWITALALDDTTLYAVGNVGAGAWRVDARDITTGASTTFSGNGTALSEDGGDDQPLAVVLEGGYLYVAGYGTAPGDNQWLIEKRATSTGLRSNDSFGANDCTGTRNIDITGGNRDAWTVQSENESTNFAYPFYAFDNDGDAALDEASAANVEFSVAVPANAAVSGIYWAGRAMSGAGGTVRLGLKDYAGFTNTTGGKSLVGASLTTALAYTDALVATGAASGGMAGYMTNPEDHVDTVNNKMNLSLVTTTAVGTTTNPVAVWDFAMVSFSWVEPEPVPVYSISITSDGSIAYGFVDLNTASSTVGGDTQTVQNDGSLSEKLNVRSSNAIGGVSWLLAGTVANDQYTHEFSTTTGSVWKSMPDSSTYVSASNAVLPSGTVDFDFRLRVPTGTTDFAEKSIAITVQAVAP